MTVILDSRIWVPEEEVNLKKVKRHFSQTAYVEKDCARCDVKPDRPTDVCRGCPAFLGDYKFYERREIDGDPYVGLAQGRKDLIDQVLHQPLADHEKIDNRPRTKWKHKIEFTGKLYDYQEDAVETAIKEKRGIIKSPPRSGKTVMSTAMVCKLGRKAIIMAHQEDLIDQFLHTFHTLTDTIDVEKFQQKRLVVKAKTLKDFEECQVALVTYQTFLSKGGKQLLEQVRHLFPVMFIDECFTQNHLVLTDQGYMKIGDLVNTVSDAELPQIASYNHQHQMMEYKPIVSKTKKQSTKLCRITMNNGSVIECTPTHRFFSTTRNNYVEAQHLTADDDILDPTITKG